MVDFNRFKRSVKEWIREHPDCSIIELQDYCEEQIPSSQYVANKWIIDQTISWYQHIISLRKDDDKGYHDEDECS